MTRSFYTIYLQSDDLRALSYCSVSQNVSGEHSSALEKLRYRFDPIMHTDRASHGSTPILDQHPATFKLMAGNAQCPCHVASGMTSTLATIIFPASRLAQVATSMKRLRSFLDRASTRRNIKTSPASHRASNSLFMRNAYTDYEIT